MKKNELIGSSRYKTSVAVQISQDNYLLRLLLKISKGVHSRSSGRAPLKRLLGNPWKVFIELNKIGYKIRPIPRRPEGHKRPIAYQDLLQSL